MGHGCVIDPVRGRRTGIGLVGLGTSRTRADLWRRQRLATRYAEDFALLAGLGLTHHRLSMEWARLEPEPGVHDPDAVEHYHRGARCRTGRRCDAVGLLAPLHVAALVRG